MCILKLGRRCRRTEGNDCAKEPDRGGGKDDIGGQGSGPRLEIKKGDSFAREGRKERRYKGRCIHL